MSEKAIKPTRAERRTATLVRRFDAHIAQWYPKLDANFATKDYAFHIDDSPFELWRCDFTDPRRKDCTDADTTNDNHEKTTRYLNQIWLLWDGAEVVSYDDEGDAYLAFIQGQKARRLESKLKYYTSPLTISAFIAILLVILVAALEYWNRPVPDQLWSILTAVIAFYFGRERSRRATGDTLGE